MSESTSTSDRNEEAKSGAAHTKNGLDSQYLSILANVSRQINWLTFTVLVIVGTNIFILYQHHFGALDFYVIREQNNLSDPENLSNVSKLLSNSKQISNLEIDKKKDSKDKEKEEKIERLKKRLAEQNSNSTNLQAEIDKARQEFEKSYNDTKAKEEIAAERLRDRLNSYKSLKERTDIITLPIIGIPLFKRDFFILYLIMGTLFLTWIYTLLSFSRNFLESLYNDAQFNSASDANSIQSLMFLIMPNEYTSKFYSYYEYFLLLFPGTIFLLILSDFWDIYLSSREFAVPILENPSFGKMWPHLTASYVISGLCLAISGGIYFLSKRLLLHIRNKLILIRWSSSAFVPAIKDYVQKKKKTIKEGESLIEYRVCDASGKHKLIVSIGLENDTKRVNIKSTVNFPKSVREFYKKNKANDQILKDMYDSDNKRIRTMEESFMKSYFDKILDDDTYEKDLCDEFKKNII